MSDGGRRKGCGCSLLMGTAAVVIVAVSAACVGYFAGRHGLNAEFGPGVGVLDVYGEVLDERPILDELDEIGGNADTKAVVVRVDSPGGSIAAVEEIYNALERLKSQGKPVVASMGSTSASGGYFVCLSADRIFANKSSLTGSIGVIVEFSSAKELFEKLGVKFDSVASGEFKAMGSISQPLSEREREHMQGVVNDFQSFFVEMVAKSRKMSAEQVRAFADGRVFTGRQALDMGLVDEIGDEDAAIRYAAGLVGLSGEPRVIRSAGPGASLWDFVDRLSSSAVSKIQRHLAAAKFVMR